MATWNATLKARDPDAGLLLRRYSVGSLAFSEGGAAVLVGDTDKAVLEAVTNAGGEAAFSFEEVDSSATKPSKTCTILIGQTSPDRMVFKFLENEAGETAAIGEYQDAELGETDFFFQPEAGQIVDLHRMIVQVRDAGSPDSGKYGNDIDLTEGIRVLVLDSEGGIILDLTDGHPIKTNAEWARKCFDSVPSSYGSGDAYVSVRWTFSKAGMPLTLSGDRGERLAVRLNDDYSGLKDHSFQVQGAIVAG